MRNLVLPVEVVVGCVVLCVLGALGIIARRFWLFRNPGTFDCSLRMPGRRWNIGVAEYGTSELRWYAFFSLRPGPDHVFDRRDLIALGMTTPQRRGHMASAPGVTIVRGHYHGEPVDLGMSPEMATGFLSWLESAPPGPAGLTY